MIDINKIEDVIKSVSNSRLLPFYDRADVKSKQDGSLITQADIAIQNAMRTELLSLYPEYGFFAEELSNTELNQFFKDNNMGFWCLDPLDGTSNFANALPFFAISLALVVDNQTYMGIVYDPMRDECFTAIRGEGAFLNGKLLTKQSSDSSELKQYMAMIDFKRLPSDLAVKLVTDPQFRSQRSFGAAALEWCWLAAGRCQLYLHGKHMLWDYAAGMLIAEEAGCYASDLSGKPVFSPSLDAKKVVAASNQSLYKQWFDYIST